MNIRTYETGDQDQVVALWKTCGLTTWYNNPVRDIQRKVDDSPDLFFVGETNDQIIATCMAGYEGHRGWIFYLAVAPEYREQGFAKAIMSHAEQALLDMGCPKVELMVRKTNNSVVKFYEQLGYNLDPVVVLSKRLYDDEPWE